MGNPTGAERSLVHIREYRIDRDDDGPARKNRRDARFASGSRVYLRRGAMREEENRGLRSIPIMPSHMTRRIELGLVIRSKIMLPHMIGRGELRKPSMALRSNFKFEITTDCRIRERAELRRLRRRKLNNVQTVP
jgi:hypothetical protein